MAIPPSYADLGKSARDTFNKGYGFGLVKLDVKTKSASGVEFTTSGSSNTDTGKVNGSLETKYKWAEYGLTFTEKRNTDNTLGTEIAIEDQIAKGLKLTFDTTFSPNTGKKSGKIKSAYKRECLNLGCDVDFDFAGPAIHGSAVFGYEGWLAGYQMTFDSAKAKLTRNNFSEVLLRVLLSCWRHRQPISCRGEGHEVVRETSNLQKHYPCNNPIPVLPSLWSSPDALPASCKHTRRGFAAIAFAQQPGLAFPAGGSSLRGPVSLF
eukprot:XP_027303269.1 voltage-dependent anion-selective channel protein 2-like [Anas platyrhynchos]